MLKQVMMIGLVLSVFQVSNELSVYENDQEYGQEVVLYVEVPLFHTELHDVLEDQIEDFTHEVPQSVIDAFYAFLEQNTPENFYVIVQGFTFTELMNQQSFFGFGRGRDVILLGELERDAENPNLICGDLALANEDAPYYAVGYHFRGICVHVYDQNYERSTPPYRPTNVPQYLIDRLADFLENNSQENRLTIPKDSNLVDELLVQLNLTEGFSLWLFLEQHPHFHDPYMACGAFRLIAYENGVYNYDEAYHLRQGACIYYHYEEESQVATPPVVTAPDTPQLPEAGSTVGGRIALGMFLVAFSGALALKQSHQIGG